MILHVVEASWAGGSRLRLAFNDGRRKLVDLRPLLEGPVFEPLRDETFFSRVSLDPICGTVVWPNGADLAPEAMLALPALEEAGCAQAAAAPGSQGIELRPLR